MEDAIARSGKSDGQVGNVPSSSSTTDAVAQLAVAAAGMTTTITPVLVWSK